MRGEHGIQHLHDGPLFGGGQRLDAFKLLRNLGLRTALACRAFGGRCANKCFDRDAELLSQIGQRTGQQAQASDKKGVRDN